MGVRRLVRIIILTCIALTAVAGLVVVNAVRDSEPKQAAEPARARLAETVPPTADSSAERGADPTAAAPSADSKHSTIPSAEATEPREFTVLMSGDVLLHENMWAQAARDAGGSGYDFRPMLEDVRPAISAADLAICHLETPVGPADGPYSGYPIFSVPPEIVPALAWAGYDACTTASNHTIDKGDAGVTRTLNALDEAEIAHAGSARTAAEAYHMTIVEVGDDAAEPVRVALLSYTYGLNGLRPPNGKEWIVELIDEDAILDDAARARMYAADVVLVALHWGLEYDHDPTSDQRELAEALLESPDVDLVYGHHAHVVQPFDVINGKWVAYGLGNHLAKQSSRRPRTHEGVMARFTFTEEPGGWTVTAAEYIPTRVPLRPPVRLLDLTAERRSEADEEAHDRVSELVESLGAAEDGLRPAG